MNRLLLVAVLLGFTLPAAVAAAKTKVACVGASTTSGAGSTAGHHYPDELQRQLGTDYDVKNFGVSGTTMLRNVSASYWNTGMLAQALAYQPDIVIIWFGGNDAKPENWTTHKGEFLGDYESMIHMFQGLPSHPRSYVILSLVIHDTDGIPKAVVDNEVLPLVRQTAADTGSGMIDVHGQLANHPEYFPDGIHPNDLGTGAIATVVSAALLAPSADAGSGTDAPPAALDAAAGLPEAGATETSGEPPDSGGAAGGASGTSGGGAPVAPPATDAATFPEDAGSSPPSSSSSSRGSGCTVTGGEASKRPGGTLLLLLIAGGFVRRRR